MTQITPQSVGRIAERIAMNELEARGYHIIDLAYNSKTSANVDFIASRNGRSLNVQVKGAKADYGGGIQRWGVHYGYCTPDSIDGRLPVFNSVTTFALMADVVVLLAVQSPSIYKSVVMPVSIAEQAAQLNLDSYYRKTNKDGGAHKPGKLYVHLVAPLKPRTINLERDQERALLHRYVDAWDI